MDNALFSDPRNIPPNSYLDGRIFKNGDDK